MRVTPGGATTYATWSQWLVILLPSPLAKSASARPWSTLCRFRDIAGRASGGPANLMAVVAQTAVLRHLCDSVAPTATSLLAAGAHRRERSKLLRHDHAPGIEDELAELVLVDGVQTNDQPLCPSS